MNGVREMHINFSEDLVKGIEEICKRENMEFGEFVVKAVMEYLERMRSKVLLEDDNLPENFVVWREGLSKGGKE